MNEAVPLPAAQHDGVVLAGVNAEPFGWPPASLDTGSGRHPAAATGEDQTKSGLCDSRGLTPFSTTVAPDGCTIDRTVGPTGSTRTPRTSPGRITRRARGE